MNVMDAGVKITFFFVYIKQSRQRVSSRSESCQKPQNRIIYTEL